MTPQFLQAYWMRLQSCQHQLRLWQNLSPHRLVFSPLLQALTVAGAPTAQQATEAALRSTLRLAAQQQLPAAQPMQEEPWMAAGTAVLWSRAPLGGSR